MADLTQKESSQSVMLAGRDELHIADVNLIGGVRKLETNTSVTVNEILGQDPIPDSYFTITAAGAIGDTIRVQLAATTSDSTAPDRDIAAVDETYTLVAADVGDELQLRDNIVAYLNAQVGFKESLKAQKAKDRAIVHITSTFFSLQNDFYERPNPGDFAVTVTGTTTISLGFDTFISRAKTNSLARDPDNPHNLGILGISGSVTVTPGAISDLFIEKALNVASSDLLVDGSVTPVDFIIPANGTKDIFITDLRFVATAGGSIKFKQFLAKNTTLANGIMVTITSDGQTTVMPLITTTEDFRHTFALGSGEFGILSQPSADDLLASFVPLASVVLKAGSSDEIKITIQDDLTTGMADLFEFIGVGFEKEA